MRCFTEQFAASAAADPDALALVLVEDDGSERRFSRGDLFARARQHAAWLQQQGLERGETVLIALDHGIELFTAIWGALLFGAVPTVHRYRPPFQDLDAFGAAVAEFGRHGGFAALYTTERLDGTGGLDGSPSAPRTIRMRAEPSDPSWQPDFSGFSPDDIALVQFSSGSTGDKKGVVLSRRAVCAYLDSERSWFDYRPGDSVASWLPLNHDMGLIAHGLLPLVLGVPLVWMSPFHWVRRPARFFQAVSRYRSAAIRMPNAAFGLATRSIRDEELDGVDLGCVRSWMNAAEGVSYDTLQAFERRFARFGLRPEALRPSYGMAEIVLGATCAPLLGGYTVDWIDPMRLAETEIAVPCAASAPAARALVSSGVAMPGIAFRIVGPDGAELPERRVGEISLHSEFRMEGYLDQPGLTAAVLSPDGWLASGDLGYRVGAELYVCGRKKDLIITSGQNLFPEDLEALCDAFEELRPGRAVAFGIQDVAAGTERAVLVAELREALNEAARRALVLAIKQRGIDRLGVLLPHVELVDAGWVIKTSSGKLARSANREKYLAETSRAPRSGAISGTRLPGPEREFESRGRMD